MKIIINKERSSGQLCTENISQDHKPQRYILMVTSEIFHFIDSILYLQSYISFYPDDSTKARYELVQITPQLKGTLTYI